MSHLEHSFTATLSASLAVALALTVVSPVRAGEPPAAPVALPAVSPSDATTVTAPPGVTVTGCVSVLVNGAPTLIGPGGAPCTQSPPPPPLAPPPPYAPYAPPPLGTYPTEASMPAVMEYDDARPIPAGYHVVVRTNYEWVAGGFAFFGLTYGTTIYVAALVGADGYHHPKIESLYYPIVGPFMAMHDLDSKGAGTFWLAVDGLCQLGGVVAGIYGLATPKKSLYRNDLRNGHVQFAPLVAASGAGLQVFGAF